MPKAWNISNMIVGNRYELRPEQGIKKGRYSKLYKAKDKKTGLWVTVKFIDENLSGLHSETFKGKWNLIKHPNLLRCLSCLNEVIDLGDGNREYLVIVNEYLAGAPISHHYAKFENEAFFKEIVSEILAGFDFLHGLNLVHRDIKCSNIFLYNEGRGLCAKLTDMDMVGEQGQKPTHFIGTPEYSAPEVFLMKPLNEGSDFWSLGCVLYELFTKGLLPFGSRLDVGGLDMLKERILGGTYNKGTLSSRQIALTDLLLGKDVAIRITDSKKIIAQFEYLFITR